MQRFAVDGGWRVLYYEVYLERRWASERFEILAYSEEICRHIIAEKKVLEVTLDLLRASLGVKLEPITVAQCSIDDLTGRMLFVALYYVKNVVRQEIITTPGHMLDVVGEYNGNYIKIHTEDFSKVNGNSDRGRSSGQLLDGSVHKPTIISLKVLE